MNPRLWEYLRNEQYGDRRETASVVELRVRCPTSGAVETIKADCIAFEDRECIVLCECGEFHELEDS